MIVLLVWGAAAVLAAILLGIVGYELVGHLRRLSAALRAAERDLGPRVRHLVDAHGGRVEAASMPARGTTISVLFPTASAA